MRSFVAGLALGIALTAAVPAVAQSPAPSDLPPPCVPTAIFAPALVGLTPDDADELAASGGLTVLYRDVESEADPGTIVTQEPAPGSTLASMEIVAEVAIAPTVTPAPTPKPTPKPVDLTTMPFGQLKAKAKSPNYKTLLRNAEAFLGKLVYAKGRVLQYLPGEDGSAATVLVSITRDRFGFWDANVILLYTGKRVIPEDIVEFVGRAGEPFTYESAGAGLITAPLISVIQLRRVK